MGAGVFYFCATFLFASPFMTIVAILAYSEIRRRVWTRPTRTRKKRAPGFGPSSIALGAAFLVFTTFYRPRMEFAIEESEHEGVEEDDQGDPETPQKLFNQQLRRIRRGEPVETLKLYL